MEEQNVPELRFPEFDDSWQNKRVGKVFSIVNGYAFSSSDAKDHGCRWIKIADVGINKMSNDSPSFLPEEFIRKHPKFVLKTNDYVIALTRPILSGKLKIAQISTELNGSLLNQRVGKLETNEYLDFVYSLLQRKSLINKIENNIAGSDPPNLSTREISSIYVFIPKPNEQQKIASFLSAVDTKIEQLTRKKELLEEYKKGVMQKLFPKAGEQHPELRFKQEDGSYYPDCEVKRLGDMLDFFTTNSLSRNDLAYEEGEIKNIHYGDIHTEFKMGFKVNEESVPYVNNSKKLGTVKNEQLLQHGDLIIADASEDYDDIGKAIEIIDINNEKIVAGLHTIHARDKNSETVVGFKSYLFRSHELRKKLMRIAQGASVLGLSKTNLVKLEVLIPKKDEQRKIVSILQNIDTRITSIEEAVQKTQSFKKGLLQQMFV